MNMRNYTRNYAIGATFIVMTLSVGLYNRFFVESDLGQQNNKSTVENLNSSADVYNNNYEHMKSEMKSAMGHIEKGDERSLQDLINLLDLELRMVFNLSDGKSGQVIEELVEERDAVLRRTTPSVAYVYSKIIDTATHDPRLYERDNLRTRERRDFLQNMKESLLIQYRHVHDVQRSKVLHSSDESRPATKVRA